MKTSTSPLFAILAAIAELACGPSVASQTGTSICEGDWPLHHGGEFSQRYSPLEIDGILYTNVGSTRNVMALNATSGQVLWLYRYQQGDRYDEAPRKGSGRGVAYWTDGEVKRVIDVSLGYHMVSLDTETGIPDPEFGDNGTVDLMVGVRNGDDPRFPYPDIGLSAPPFVMNDVIVVGAAHRTGGRPRTKMNTKGDIRGFDARTGELLWTCRPPGRPPVRASC